MRVKFPEKIDNTLRFLKYKLLPKTLFFRTMLLIFIPLIVVQVVSIVAFFDGSWGRVGRRLSNNLTSDMSFVMQLIEKSPDKLQEIKKVTDETLDMSVSVYLNKDKHRIINKVSRNNELVTGFLESGKTTFLDFTLQQEYFSIDGKTLFFQKYFLDFDFRFCRLDDWHVNVAVFGCRAVFAHTGSFDCRTGSGGRRFR